MTRGLTITKQVCFCSGKRGRKVIEEGAQAKAPDLGRVPRVSRLMALAIHMEDLDRQGEVADYAELAFRWPAGITFSGVGEIVALKYPVRDMGRVGRCAVPAERAL